MVYLVVSGLSTTNLRIRGMETFFTPYLSGGANRTGELLTNISVFDDLLFNCSVE